MPVNARSNCFVGYCRRKFDPEQPENNSLGRLAHYKRAIRVLKLTPTHLFIFDKPLDK